MIQTSQNARIPSIRFKVKARGLTLACKALIYSAPIYWLSKASVSPSPSHSALSNLVGTYLPGLLFPQTQGGALITSFRSLNRYHLRGDFNLSILLNCLKFQLPISHSPAILYRLACFISFRRLPAIITLHSLLTGLSAAVHVYVGVSAPRSPATA